MDVLTVTPNPSVDVYTSTEKLTPFTKLRCAAPRYDAGGGGVNVARVVKRLGGDPLALLPAGGSSGEMLLRLLAGQGVRTEAIPFDGETRQDFTVFDRTGESQYQFVLPGPELPAETWQACLDRARKTGRHPRILVGSGSLPQGVPVDFYGRLASVAKEMGARAVVDCAGPALRAAVAEGVHLIKPNLREFQELVGRKVTDEAGWLAEGRALVAGGKVDYIALTLGAEGALLIGADIALRADGVRLKPASVIGAGDSFVGALSLSLAAGDPIETAFRNGVAAGTAATLNAGTELCRAEDVHRLLAQVALRRI